MNIRCLNMWVMLAALLLCEGVWAQECYVDSSGINFGEYHPLSNQVKDATGRLRVVCDHQGVDKRNVSLCIGLQAGSAGSSIDNRRMLSTGGSTLPYQIYKDAAHTQIWGTGNQRWTGTVQLEPGVVTVIAADLRLYGRIPADLEDAVPGTYDSSYPHPGQIEFNYASASPPSFHNCLLSNPPPEAVKDFTVTATVPHKCEIISGPGELDFGSVTGLEIPALTNAFRVDVRCTRNTEYRILLDDGVFSSGPGRRRMRGDNGFIDYEIFQDANLSTRWGDTASGSTGVFMGTLTGDAMTHAFIGYGLVPAQTAPGLGLYLDRVTVTVQY